MANTVVRVYDVLSNAEQARRELLSAGFPESAVQLSSGIDEAGPVEGNGILDEKDTGHGPADGTVHSLLGGEERTDAYNNTEPVWRGGVMLTVEAGDEAQSTRASAIMDSHGAVDIDALTAKARRH